jgi:hypothetical protein
MSKSEASFIQNIKIYQKPNNPDLNFLLIERKSSLRMVRFNLPDEPDPTTHTNNQQHQQTKSESHFTSTSKKNLNRIFDKTHFAFNKRKSTHTHTHRFFFINIYNSVFLHRKLSSALIYIFCVNQK